MPWFRTFFFIKIISVVLEIFRKKEGKKTLFSCTISILDHFLYGKIIYRCTMQILTRGPRKNCYAYDQDLYQILLSFSCLVRNINKINFLFIQVLFFVKKIIITLSRIERDTKIWHSFMSPSIYKNSATLGKKKLSL